MVQRVLFQELRRDSFLNTVGLHEIMEVEKLIFSFEAPKATLSLGNKDEYHVGLVSGVKRVDGLG